MTQYERDLSNLSYTNKDFGKIYPELLDLVKKISYKWDPSQSDESDPGVVLLKLAALMADKNNYNIDKNILETFPLSVTQLENARQIFEQCGYCMKYYRSATTSLSMTLVKGCEPTIGDDDIAQLSPTDPAIDINDGNERYYVIPKYTMVSDLENSVVYTLTQDTTLCSDGITVDNIPAVQGVINTYTINGENVITAANLDYNNRLYFTELDIPENGIFIEGSSQHTWVKVDNLVLQPLGTYCYKFGIAENGSCCYLEFPSDIDSLIGNGITIYYLRTKGFEGNVGKKRLCQFYTDVKSTRYIDAQYPQEVTLSTYESANQGNVYITNLNAATDGENPESIDSAYRNYQKIKTTFETLVSCLDYENFLYTNKNVSNSFVCNRTNDIQSAYKIVDSDNTYSKTVSAIHTQREPLFDDDGAEIKDAKGQTILVSKPEMTAFDLKIYGLQYVDDPTTTDGFNKTFTIIKQQGDVVTDWSKILLDTEDIKSIPHNYQPFEEDRIIMLMNRYPIVSRIIPHYKLELKQQEEVTKTIIAALYKVLNARVIDFGEPIEYDLVYDTIINADPRIKAITLDDITYSTYAMYISSSDANKEIQELRIDTLSSMPELLPGEPDSIITDTSSEFWNSPRQLWHRFRREIYAKSVLAGKTQLLSPDSRFQYGLSQKNSNLVVGAHRITTNTDIVLTKVEGEKVTYSSIPLQENENLVFTAPNMIDDVPYSSYVKFLHNIRPANQKRKLSTVALSDNDTIIEAEDDYTLAQNEYIVFFWKTQDDEYAPYQYIKYSGDATSDVKCISPTFRMLAQREPDSRLSPPVPESILASLPSGVRGLTNSVKDTVKWDPSNPSSPSMSFTEFISGISGSEFVLTGSNTITTKKTNKIHINNTENGTNHVYWILNDVKDSKCTLFIDTEDLVDEDDVRDTCYTLKTGEYFIYSNDARTQLHILGSGTKITRSSGGREWTCPAIDYDEFISSGVYYFDEEGHSWFTIPVNFDVEATEMQFYQIGPKYSIKLEYEGPDLADGEEHPEKITFNNSGVFSTFADGEVKPQSLYNYRISYLDGTNTTTLSRRNTIEDAWTAYSMLNLNTSSSKSQLLDSHQSLKLMDEEGAEITTISNNDQTSDGIRILTNRTISLTGGINLDCTTIDLVNNTILPLEVYAFEFESNFSNEKEGYEEAWSFDSYQASAILPANVSNAVQELEFTLPLGTYILPITVVGDVTKLQLELTCGGRTGVLKTLSGSTAYKSAGTHYIAFEVTGQQATSLIGACKLKVTSTVTANISASVLFDKLFKYTIPNLQEAVNEDEYEYRIDDFTAKDIAVLIDKLDNDHLFNYTYIVPDEDLVRNPLVASSFVDTNHIFNPFTICRWDTSSKLNKLAIITKIK